MVRNYGGRNKLYSLDDRNFYNSFKSQLPNKNLGSPLCMSDVEFIYYHLNGRSCRGFPEFRIKLKEIAGYARHHYMFKDETKLFELLNEKFGDVLEELGISTFDHLMRLFS